MKAINAILNFIKAINRYRRERVHFLGLKHFQISDSGYEENLVYVRLSNDFIFYGYPSDHVQELQYHLFAPKGIKQKTSPSQFNVVLDIVKRYLLQQNLAEARWKDRFINMKAGDVFVEGGAFTGYYAMNVSKIVGDAGLVIAIEAVPENFYILKKNIDSNGLKNVIAINKALFNEKKKMTFYRDKKQEGSLEKDIINYNQLLEVQADTLDNILKEFNIKKVDFVRLQLNGGEYNALLGMSNTIQQLPQMLIAARYKLKDEFLADKIANFFQSQGIKSNKIKGNICVNLNKKFVSQ